MNVAVLKDRNCLFLSLDVFHTLPISQQSLACQRPFHRHAAGLGQEVVVEIRVPQGEGEQIRPMNEF